MWEFVSGMGYWYIAIGFASLFWALAALALVSMFVELNLTYICERSYTHPALLVWMFNIMTDKKDQKKAYNLTEEDVVQTIFLGYVLAPAIAFAAWPVTIFALLYYLMLRTLRFMVRIKKGIMKLITNKKCLAEYTEKDTPEMEF